MRKLALGTAQFGMKYGIANTSIGIKDYEISKILRLCEFKNISTIDTAIAYGHSEESLGKEDLGSFDVITKIPPLEDSQINTNTGIRKQIRSSLKRLNKNKLYAVLLHNSKDLIGPHGKILFETLTELKEEKLISNIGVSIYNPNELENIIPNYKIDIVQSPFSIIDRRLEISGWLKILHQNKIEIHSRSIFLQGLLLMDSGKIPLKFNKWRALFKKWEEDLSKINVTKMEACIQFALSFQEINKVIIGIDNIKQLKEILAYDFSKNIEQLGNISTQDEMLINPTYWDVL